jgi:hypothetical protein
VRRSDPRLGTKGTKREVPVVKNFFSEVGHSR